MVFRPCLWALIFALPSVGYSDDLINEGSDASFFGGFSESYRTRMNKNTEVFVKNCDNPSPPLSHPEKWCPIPPGWASNPGDIQEGRTATEIWQPTGRCLGGYKFNAIISQCVPILSEACTWGQNFNPKEKMCEPINTDNAHSPNCEIKGFNSERDGTGQWLYKTIPASLKKIYAYVSCQTKEEISFIPICNLKNLSANKQTNWYKCMGPDPLNRKSFWIEINLSEISKDEKDNQILFEVRGAYSKTPLNFHESTVKTFLYKI